MKIAICDSNPESLNILLEVLNNERRKMKLFSDYVSLFKFFNKQSSLTDLILMISNAMYENVDKDVNYFIKKFDVTIPIFTYNANQAFITSTMNYIYEYTQYYTISYISELEKIKSAFLHFKGGEEDLKSVVSHFCERQIFYNNETKETAKKSIFPKYMESSVEENELLASSLNQQQKRLLSYLVSNYKGVKIEEIMLHIWNCKDESKRQNAYVLVHSLKKILEDKTVGRYTIEKSCKKYRLTQIVA